MPKKLLKGGGKLLKETNLRSTVPYPNALALSAKKFFRYSLVLPIILVRHLSDDRNNICSSIALICCPAERRVCQREIIDVDALGDADNKSQMLNGKLMSGEKFVTPFGIVQVVADNRFPSSSDHNSVQDCPQSKEMRKEVLSRRKNRTYMAAAKFQRRRRHVFMRLFNENVTGEKLQQEIWKEYCSLASPQAILSGEWSWKTYEASTKEGLPPHNDHAEVKEENTDPIYEKMDDRIVECVLIKDERRKITDIEDDILDDGHLSKIGAAKASVEKARREAVIANKCIESVGNVNRDVVVSNVINESGLKLFLQRRLLVDRYNDTMPHFVCIRCSRSFSSRLGLKGHLQERVCEKKTDQLVRERLDRLEMIESALGGKDVKFKDKYKSGPTVIISNSFGTKKIKASLFKKLPGWIVFHHDRSSMYPEVTIKPMFMRTCLLGDHTLNALCSLHGKRFLKA
jgi:hypothetical protein